MAKQIYIDSNGNEVLVSGTITNDNNLPHYTGTPTQGTTAYEIASKADKATTLAGYGITNAYTKDDIDNYNVRRYATAWGTSCQTTLGRYQFLVLRGFTPYVVWLASMNDINVANVANNTSSNGTGSVTFDNMVFTRLSDNNLKVELSSNGAITIIG